MGFVYTCGSRIHGEKEEVGVCMTGVGIGVENHAETKANYMGATVCLRLRVLAKLTSAWKYRSSYY